AHAGRLPAFGGYRLELVRRTVDSDAIAVLGDVAPAGRRPAFCDVGPQAILRAIRILPVAEFRQVALARRRAALECRSLQGDIENLRVRNASGHSQQFRACQTTAVIRNVPGQPDRCIQQITVIQRIVPINPCEASTRVDIG
ncbi:MAG: hypothetical protein JRF07_03135, partial [Deltaproteobacteria bacterium]|nr:hypothetical protein [Deltaproteobacteria bacterium]